MKICMFSILFLFAFVAAAEEEGEADSVVHQQRISRCRQQRIHPGRMNIEDVEYCQNLLLHESLERFNKFVEQRGPVVDCQEAREAPALVAACRSAGIQKVKLQASSFGTSVKDKDVYVCDVDNSHWLFSNYVWFCADTPRGKISQMTQKPLMGNCF